MKSVFAAVLALFVCMPGEFCAAAGDRQQAEETPLRYFTQPAGVQGSRTPYGDNAACGRYVQAGDARIYYEVYGEGEPLFVFHGGGVGSPYEMGGMLDRLRDRFKVVVVSTRGHGRSEIGHSPLTYEQKAQDMLAVMDEITDRPARVLGFSDGAYTAYKLAVMHPERVERVAAIGAGTLEPGYFPAENPISALEKADRAYVEQMRRLAPEPERLQEFLSAYMTFWSGMHVGQETFGQIRCPVLLVTGDHDDHAPVLSVLEAHQMIPDSRLCVVPGAWHTAFLDNFAVTWDAVSGFLYADAGSLPRVRKLEQNNVRH